MRIALDSNILLYWLGLAKRAVDLQKVEHAQVLVPTLIAGHDLVIPGQTIGEAYNVLTKAGESRDRARDRLLPILHRFEAGAPSAGTYRAALDLAARHKLQVWDALIIRLSVEARCDLLLSEDMQDGFRVGGLTIANPFATAIHPLLAALLGA